MLVVLVALWPVAITEAQEDEAAGALGRVEALLNAAAAGSLDDQQSRAREALALIDREPMLASFAWIREPLTVEPPRLEQARVRVAAVKETLAPKDGRIDPREARSGLASALADPRMQEASLWSVFPEGVAAILLLLWAVVAAIWAAVTAPANFALRGIEGVLLAIVQSPAVVLLAALVLGLLITFYVRSLQSTIVREQRFAPPDGQTAVTASTELTLAQELERSGQHREACHHLFVSLLLWIEERGLARFPAAATNREYLRALAAEPRIRSALWPLVERFDQLWYGGQSVGAAEYDELSRLTGRVREAVL